MPSAVTDPADHWSPLAERQLEMLSELVEIGMDVARGVGRLAKQVTAESDADPERQATALGHVTLAYSRASRAVRMTLLLQSKLVEILRKGAADAESQVEQTRLAAAQARKQAAERVVERLARDEHPRAEWDVERIVNEAAERLEHEELDGGLTDLPFGELLQRLCGDLGLTPDPARLAGLAAAAEHRLSAAARRKPGPSDTPLEPEGLEVWELGDWRPQRRYGPPWPKPGDAAPGADVDLQDRPSETAGLLPSL